MMREGWSTQAAWEGGNELRCVFGAECTIYAYIKIDAYITGHIGHTRNTLSRRLWGLLQNGYFFLPAMLKPPHAKFQPETLVSRQRFCCKTGTGAKLKKAQS